MLKQAKKQSKSEIMSSITMATKTTSWKDAEDCPVDNSSQNDTINNEFKKDEDSCFEFIVEGSHFFKILVQTQETQETQEHKKEQVLKVKSNYFPAAKKN